MKCADFISCETFHCLVESQRSSQNHKGWSGWGLELCALICPLPRTLSSPAGSKALGRRSHQPWVLGCEAVDSSEHKVIVPSREQGSHADQKLLSSLTPLSRKLPLPPSLTHTPPGLLSKQSPRGVWESSEPLHACHCGSLGLAVCSYSRRTVFRGPFGSCLPPPNPSLSSTFNPLMVSFIPGFSGSNSLPVQDLSYVSGTPAAWGQGQGVQEGRESGDHR